MAKHLTSHKSHKKKGRGVAGPPRKPMMGKAKKRKK